MKCLIIDEVDSCIAQELSKYMQVDTMLHLKHSGLEDVIGDYEILVMRVLPRIDEEVLKHAKKLKYIAVCAIGTDHIDMKACEAHGVEVQNAPGVSSNSVSELTVCKMLELSRSTLDANRQVTEDHCWPKNEYLGHELTGRTVGILGFGRIGQRVGFLSRAFGMKVLAYDPYLPAEIFEKEEAESCTIDEILERAEYVCIHVPLTPETKDLISAKQIEKMRPGAVVINMSRGGIVNEADMAEALRTGRLGGYGTDVMVNEFSDADTFVSPLFDCRGFAVTPHLGAQTVETRRSIGRFIVQKITERFFPA